jgi:hypothetical protein
MWVKILEKHTASIFHSFIVFFLYFTLYNNNNNNFV